ncbi:MAG: hypothetical protein KY455_10120 [Euryarchaeota archaeon]|nr:hypothetical protein [Euryarchaeota archaeon]
MDEEVLFRNGSLVVTSSRIFYNGTTYTTKIIRSVSHTMEEPSTFWPTVLIWTGGVGTFVLWKFTRSFFSLFLFILAIIGGIWREMQSPIFYVVLNLTEGERLIWGTKNLSVAHELLDAINKVIVQR